MPTYVIFDAQNDWGAYGLLHSWRANSRTGFDFINAHQEGPRVPCVEVPAAVKPVLRARMRQSGQILVLVGDSTASRRGYVPWEIETAVEGDWPIVVANLNGERRMDRDRCPAVLQREFAMHVGFEKNIIERALKCEWLAWKRTGPRYFIDAIYDEERRRG